MNPKCYAHVLGGCSSKVSREHFFSRGVLNVLDVANGGAIDGFPWQQSSSQTPSIESLQSKVLCKNHNEALSPLDEVGSRLFGSLRTLDAYLAAETPKEHECSATLVGQDVERWLLKTLIGLVASGNAMHGNKKLQKSHPPIEWLNALFAKDDLPDAWGLYARVQRRHGPLSDFGFAPILPNHTVAGCLFQAIGLEFVLVMQQPGPLTEDSLLANAIYRPAFVRLHDGNSGRNADLIFNWNGAGSQNGVVAERIPRTQTCT